MKKLLKKNSPLRTMKRLAVCAMLMIVCVHASAQNKDFEELAKIDGIEYQHLDKKAISEAVKQKQGLLDDVEANGISFDKVEIMNNIAKILNMDDLMVFSCTEEKAVEPLKKSVVEILKGDGWEAIIDVKGDDGQVVKIYQNETGDKKTSVIFGSDKDDTKLMVIEGALGILQMMPYHRLLYRVAYRLTENAQDAEDLLQDTYLKLWQKRNDLKEEAMNEAYLVTMMRNLFRDQRRLKRIDTSIELEKVAEPSEERSLDHQIDSNDEAMQMEGLIQQLPERDGRIIKMHLMEERSYEEIEQDTGLSQGNIRIIVMRTKKKLKQQFIHLTKTWTN